MRFRIIVYMHVTMATGSIIIYTNMKPYKNLFPKITVHLYVYTYYIDSY